MAKRIILCDTNIIIELYKNNSEIVSELQLIDDKNIAVSAITAGELIFGAQNKKELHAIKRDLASILVLPLSENISYTFIELMTGFSKSHGLTIPDAIIAATAIVNNLELFTLNKKDFKYIDDLKLYPFGKSST